MGSALCCTPSLLSIALHVLGALIWSSGWLPWEALANIACAWCVRVTVGDSPPLVIVPFAVDATPHRDWQAVAEQREDELTEAHQQLQEMSQASAALEKSLLAELETVSCGVCGQPVRPGFLRHHARAHSWLGDFFFFSQVGLWAQAPPAILPPQGPCEAAQIVALSVVHACGTW